MKRTTFLYAMLILLGCLLAPALLSAQEPTGPAEHTVVKGDTLWDISGKYLSDPFMWPELWRANPDISNPDLIFPGNKVKLPGAPTAAAAGKEGEKTKSAKQPAAGKGKGFPIEEEPLVDISNTLLVIPEEKDKRVISMDEKKTEKVPVSTIGEILEAGYISEDADAPILISGPAAAPERLLYSEGDEVLVLKREDLKPGDFLITFREGEEVEHPATGDDLGRLIKVTGLLKVIGEKDGYLLCKVVRTINDIRREDMALPYKMTELVYEPVPKNPALRGEWGYIVAAKENRTVSGTTYTVFLDLGSDDDVRPGDRFVIRRSGGESYTGEGELPDIEMGEVQVISVQGTTSAAKVVAFDESVRAGQRVYYKD